MGSRGPKKEPVSIKKHEGRYRPRDGEDGLAEYLPSYAEIPKHPEELNADGQSEWYRVWEYGIDIPGYLMKTDATALFEHCWIWQELQDAKKDLKESGRFINMYKVVGLGSEAISVLVDTKISPQFKIVKDLIVAYQKSSATFGLNPSDRARVGLMVGMGKKVNEGIPQLK